MRNFDLDIDYLKEIYLVSNTPLYLFKNFTNDSSLQELKLNKPTNELVEEFIELSNKELTNIDELVYAYAIYIAILLKDDELTNSFIEEEGNINFEWFGDLKNLYREKVTPTYSFEINEEYSNSSQKLSHKSDDNINDLEVEFV